MWVMLICAMDMHVKWFDLHEWKWTAVVLKPADKKMLGP